MYINPDLKFHYVYGPFAEVLKANEAWQGMWDPCEQVVAWCRKYELRIKKIESARPEDVYRATAGPVLKVKIGLSKAFYPALDDYEWSQIELKQKEWDELEMEMDQPIDSINRIKFASLMKKSRQLCCMSDVLDLEREQFPALKRHTTKILYIYPHIVDVAFFRANRLLTVYNAITHNVFNFKEVLALTDAAFDRYRLPVRTTSQRHHIVIRWRNTASKLEKTYKFKGSKLELYSHFCSFMLAFYLSKRERKAALAMKWHSLSSISRVRAQKQYGLLVYWDHTTKRHE